MTTYSFSKISTFQECPFKYKLHYIDRAEVDTPTTVEAFMGALVHKTLEKLYKDLRFQKVNSLDKILHYYNENWEKEWTDDILIVKSEYRPENYQKMGEKYLRDYYGHYAPFDEMRIIDLETQDLIDLPDGSKYHIRIDKLGCVGNTYYVCDYKTNMRMKDQEEADTDKQLAMYSIWVKNKFPDASKIVLKWHMLAFDKEIQSERSSEQLDELVKKTTENIIIIEQCSDFLPSTSNLCNYCGYRSYCPPFKHEYELSAKTIEEFKKDDGVQMVDEYSQLMAQKKMIADRLEELKKDLIAFSNQQSISMVYGSNKTISIREYQKVILPDDRAQLIGLLKEKGLYDEMSSLNYYRLSGNILSGKIDDEIKQLVKIEPDYRISVSNRLFEGQ